MKKIILILFLIITTIIPSFATEWKQISDKLYMDVQSIEPFVDEYGRKDFNKYIFWTKKLNDNSKSFTYLEGYYKKKIEYFVDKQVIDVPSKKIAIKSNNIYGTDATLLHRFDTAGFRTDWHNIIPDTDEQILYYEVAKYKEELDKKKAEEIERIKAKQLAEEQAKVEAELESDF